MPKTPQKYIDPSYPLRQRLEKSATQTLIKGGLPARFAELSAWDLYGEFLKWYQDEKGLFASGIGLAKLSVQLNFVLSSPFDIPGLMNFGISAGAFLRAEGGKAILLALHHGMPRTMSPPGPTTVPIWDTARPCGFMSFNGSSIQLEARLSAMGSAALWTADTGAVMTNPTLTELPMMLGVTAGIAERYQFELLSASDAAPHWYPGKNDTALRDRFNEVLGENESLLKQRIIAWTKRFGDQIFQLSDQKPILADAILTDVHERLLADQQKPSTISQVAQTFKKRFPKKLFPSAIWASVDLVATGLNQYKAGKKTPEDLDALLEKLKGAIPSDDAINTFYGGVGKDHDDEIAVMKNGLHALKAQMSLFQRQLAELIRRKTQPSMPTLTTLGADQFLSYLKISSHFGGNTGGVTCSIPLLTEARVDYEASYKEAAYRYQTFARSEKNQEALVFTQDSRIRYRTVSITGQSHILDIYKKKGILNYASHGVTYRSINAYWLYPDGDNPGMIEVVDAEPGSGVSYGVSVIKQDLLACIKYYLGKMVFPHGVLEKLLQNLSSYLHLEEAKLRTFFQTLDDDMLKRIEDLPVDVLLLESNFRFPESTQLKVHKKVKTLSNRAEIDVYRLGGLWSDDMYVISGGSTFLNHYQSASSCSTLLDAIRLRARYADYEESETVFKLGFVVGAIRAQINLGSVRKAGQEGVQNIVSKTYPSPLDPNISVPPVALFFQ